MNNLLLTVLLSFFSHSYGTDSGSRDFVIPIDYSFHGVVVYSNMIVYIKEAEKNEIIVKDKEAANNFKFKVDHGVLVVHGKKSFFSDRIRGNIIINVKDIHAIIIMDDAEVRTIGALNDKDLNLEIFGDGAIYANTSANEVTTFIKGLGKIELIGNFKNTSVNKDAYGNMITTYK